MTQQKTKATAVAETPPAASEQQAGRNGQPERELLLDFSELTNEPIRARDGNRYYLRTAGLGAVEHHRLTHCASQHDELFAKATLTKQEQNTMVDLLDEMLELILDAPKEVRDMFGGQQKRQLIAHFQRASRPDGELMDGLAALAQALQTQSTDTEPERSSTMAS